MYTPKGQHYRRTHYPIPLVDEKKYRLSVEIENKNNYSKKFSLNDIKKKKKKEVSVTIMCTGSRRGEFNKHGITAGLAWENSISTSKWKGCLLKDILNDCGIFYIDLKDSEYNFITFLSIDGYRISIPLSKGMDINGDCILAYIMNNETIPRDHGYPLRVIVPGYVGARSVKWLNKIILTKKEVIGPHQTGFAYKQFPPNYDNLSKVPKEMIDELPPIDIVPVTSGITSPNNNNIGSIINGKILNIRGYAFSGGGRAIIRVDVSINGGNTWNQATLKRAINTDGTVQSIRCNKAWAWCQWICPITIPQNINQFELCCKAIDDQYNQQPDTVQPIWNVRGLLNTAWARTNVKLIRSRL